MIDRSKQTRIAKKLYESDPGRTEHGDSDCWLAACLAAYALVSDDYSEVSRNTILDYYGTAAIESCK